MTRHLLPQRTDTARRLRAALVALSAACLVAVFVTAASRAANPTSGTVTLANTPGNPLVFTGGPYATANPSNFVELVCQNPALPCDDFTLHVDVPSDVSETKQVRVAMFWGNTRADFDFRVYKRNANGTAGEEVKSIGTSTMPEIGLLPAVKQSYIVRIIPFAPLGESVRVEVTVEPRVARFNQAAGGAPGYKNYPATGGLGAGAAEPTLGINWNTGRVMFIAGTQTLRVTFDDTVKPATALWEDKSYLLTSIETLDPILYTDRETGRTIVSQLAGTNSLSALTDDDGESWIPNEGGPLTSGVDHQTVGGGPFAPPLTGGVPGVYPNAVYYCSQDAVTAFCARSDDGGLTYGPTVPMFLLNCGGIHGHVQVGPDGAVYVPLRSCDSNQGMVVSQDNGLTWTIRTVADADKSTSTFDSLPGSWDPAIGVGSRGTVYFGYDHADGTPHIAVSRDKGITWTDDQNVGVPFGIRGTAFPTVIAGDDDRAAFAFLGTNKEPKDPTGQWHLYVATTYDGGKTWHTVDATPNDPVQIGWICDEGFGVGACPNGDRNLLDFIDIQVDKEGRVLVAYADGCVGCTTASSSRSELATIARQTCGRRLFAQYDSAAEDCGTIPTPTPTPTATPTPPPITGTFYFHGTPLDEANKALTFADASNQGTATWDQNAPTEAVAITQTAHERSNADYVGNTLAAYWRAPASGSLTGSLDLTLYLSTPNPETLLIGEEIEISVFADPDYVANRVQPHRLVGRAVVPVGSIGPTPTLLQGSVPVNGVAQKELMIQVRPTFIDTGAALLVHYDSTGTPSGFRLGGGATPTPTPTPTATPTPTPTGEPKCTAPGPTVLTDAANDQLAGPNANRQLDIHSLKIAEPFVSASDSSITFTMKVDNLTGTVQPNSIWNVYFNARDTGGTVRKMFVSMNTSDAPVLVTFNYGYTAVGPTGGGLDTSQCGILGCEQVAGSFSADGTITIKLNTGAPIPFSDINGNPVFSANLKGGNILLDAVTARTQLLVGALGTGSLQTADTTGVSTYTTIGNAACQGAGTPTPTPTATPTPTPPVGISTPRFHNYSPPAAVGENAAEPSIGFNTATKRAMYIAGLQTLQVTFPENIAPAGSVPEAAPAQWKDVSFLTTKTRSLDPILFTDQNTGRTFVSQLNSVAAAVALVGANSLMAFSDDDGATWTPAQLNLPDGSNDHQTVGSGPYPASVPLGNDINKGSAVYYCGQMGNVLVATSVALCSRSDNGGLTFNRPTPVYPGSPVPGGCSQLLHGHVKVAPDGTVYLPNAQCGGRQAVAVSTDAGTTWTVRGIPGSLTPAGILDPSVGISNDPPEPGGTSNTIYVGYTGRVPGGNATDNHAYVAVSRDRGVTWSTPVDLGASHGIKNAVWAQTVAGDANRAAVAFLGTTTSGDHQAADFKGTWYGYVAYTYDGGKTWTTVLATPNGPVQREACIWNGGGNNPCRNLLDFNDVTIDDRGRVLFAYADGCVDQCEKGGANTYSAKATIARQSGGTGLLSRFDTPEPAHPKRPYLEGRRDDMASYLTWAAPDNGGSAITAYKIYRGTAPGNEVLIGQAAGTATGFNDRSGGVNVASYTYKVTAVNVQGESAASNTVSLAVGPRVEQTGACTLPGVTAISDPAGDASNGQPFHDITSVSMAEPQDMPGKLVFTIKVAGMSTVPPGWRWAVRFNAPQRPPNALYGATEDWFVSMVTSDGAQPTFTYGTTGVPQGAARVFTTVGNLDPASNAKPDGSITLVLPKSAIGNPQPGQAITGMLGSVRATVPSALPGTGGTNETIPDSTGGGSYTLRPADLCLPNSAPLAALTADAESGPAPLTVRFDASASSDPDAIDSIASYTFNFSDGSDDVTQSSPVIHHTFALPGEYPVMLVVTDSRGKVSANTARFKVKATGAESASGGAVLTFDRGFAAMQAYATGQTSPTLAGLNVRNFLVGQPAAVQSASAERPPQVSRTRKAFAVLRRVFGV